MKCNFVLNCELIMKLTFASKHLCRITFFVKIPFKMQFCAEPLPHYGANFPWLFKYCRTDLRQSYYYYYCSLLLLFIITIITIMTTYYYYYLLSLSLLLLLLLFLLLFLCLLLLLLLLLLLYARWMQIGHQSWLVKK